MKLWLQDNDIEIYSTYNEGKSAVAERFIRTLNKKNYKYININIKCINNLAYIVNKYYNTYHSTIRMKPADVNSSAYIDLNKENNKEVPKCEVGNHVRISKYKNIFAKASVPNWSEEVFVIKKVKNTVLWSYVTSDLKHEKIVGTFCKRELQKPNEKQFRVEKIIKRKVDELYVK